VRNTKDQLALVDLEFYFGADISIEDRIKVCKDFLTHIGEEITDKNVQQVLTIYNEAYYGGTAYAMIQADLSHFYTGDNNNAIKLTDLKLGIIDTYN
jgi:hypothetical protein